MFKASRVLPKNTRSLGFVVDAANDCALVSIAVISEEKLLFTVGIF
jgi:hypothetical protein